MGAPKYIGCGTDDANYASETNITATASGTQLTGYRLTAVVSRITTCATALVIQSVGVGTIS